MAAELILSIALAGLLSIVTLVTSQSAAKASQRLDDRRQSIYALEAALLDAQAGRPMAPGVSLAPLDDAPPAAGMQWVRATMQTTHGEISLVGVMPLARGGAR
jgi:hypothetical protein